MPHSSTVSFISYWRGLQPSPETAPTRDSFDPARLKSLIPQMIMVSTADQSFRFRLSGGFLVAFHGYELKDRSLLGLFRSPFTNTVRTALGTSLRREQPLILTVTAPWQPYPSQRSAGDGQSAQAHTLSHNETVSFEICLCPIANRDGDIDRFVGIYQTLSAMPQNPHGSVGRYTLMSARLYEHHRLVRAAHLRLVASEGLRIA